ncbi:hypothetical protein ILUMI_05488 [Ignelater luminosus]|uniref:Uncharacterized protein n=1 Tax=Ignelater luminosus TaxID=2038154 RepID=A0A8K0DB00_IGNLU|nr:hypothetical protein ILUMI_05488 [Ignelater luminosus]
MWSTGEANANKTAGKSGKRSAASVLQDITSTSPKRAQRYRCAHKSWTSGEDRSVKRTLIINAKLSKHQYLLIRSASQSYNANISLFKNKILEAKRKCLPVATIVTENSAEIKLQCILDLTTQRICSYHSSVLQTVPNESKSFTMIYKQGCDSSSGQNPIISHMSHTKMLNRKRSFNTEVLNLLVAPDIPPRNIQNDYCSSESESDN